MAIQCVKGAAKWCFQVGDRSVEKHLGYEIDPQVMMYDDETDYVTEASAVIYKNGEWVDEVWESFEPEDEYDDLSAMVEVTHTAKIRIDGLVEQEKNT